MPIIASLVFAHHQPKSTYKIVEKMVKLGPVFYILIEH